MSDFNALFLADALTSARKSGKKIPAGELVPPDLEAAMQVQAAVFGRTGEDLRGWKAAIRPDGQVICAPMTPFIEPGNHSSIEWPGGMGLEIEIAFVLGRDLSPAEAGRCSREDVIDAIASVHLGVELVASRLAEGTEAPPLLFLADALANDGYLLGPALPFDAGSPGDRWHLSVQANGETVFESDVTHPTTDPLLPLLALANASPGPLGGLKAGQVVTTGSLCGLLRVNGPGAVAIRFERTHDMAFTLTAG